MFRVSSGRGPYSGAPAVASMMFALAVSAAPVQAAPGAQPSSADEIGLRFTPEIARGLARLITKEMIASRYELAPERMDEATERITRRLMAFAHENQDRAQEFAEFIGSEALVHFDGPGGSRRNTGIPRSLGRGFGKRILPIMPSVQKLVTGVREDVQPLLPPKQQMRLMGDMVALGAAMDAFETHMKRWSEGDVDPYANPFQPRAGNEPDAAGESQVLAEATQQAQWALENSVRPFWEQYVKDAKELYALDKAQAATADSILAEALRRAEQIGADPARREIAYRLHVWWLLWRPMGLNQYHPSHVHLIDVLTEQRAALDEIGEELRVRVDEIPTDAQCEAAERRIRAAMAGTGLDVLLDETR